MLQDIQPHSFDIAFKRKHPGNGDYIAILGAHGILLANGEDGAFLPTLEALTPLLPSPPPPSLYLFSVDGSGFFHCPVELPAADGFAYIDFQDFRNFDESWKTFAGITACHLAQWSRQNRFCGFCGAPTAPKEDERALRCTVCGLVVYPRISPAVIVAVTDGDRLLATIYANRNYRRHALIAGFMEAGETAEDTVRREVFEEVGVRVKNVRYYKSQPWAFSGSVLMGFFADLDGLPDITLDENELSEAEWIRRGDIPPADSTMSLTSTMIEAFRDGDFPA